MQVDTGPYLGSQQAPHCATRDSKALRPLVGGTVPDCLQQAFATRAKQARNPENDIQQAKKNTKILLKKERIWHDDVCTTRGMSSRGKRSSLGILCKMALPAFAASHLRQSSSCSSNVALCKQLKMYFEITVIASASSCCEGRNVIQGLGLGLRTTPDIPHYEYSP